MANFKVGRIGLDIAMRDPAERSDDHSVRRGYETTWRGFLRASSAADTILLRKELLEQVGKIVAVDYSVDPSMNGFYILSGVQVDAEPFSFNNLNYFEYEISALRVGSESSTELQSLLTGTVVTSDFSWTESSSIPIFAPPQGHLAYGGAGGGGTGVTVIQRTLSNGEDIDVYTDVPFTDDPTWAVDVADYYNGACEIWVGDGSGNKTLRAGLDCPNESGDWYMQNGLIRVEAGHSGYVNDGTIEISTTNETDGYESATDFSFTYNIWKISAWQFVNILRNDPEACAIRLVRDAAPASNAGRHTFDILMRRGSRQIYCYWSYSGGPSNLYILRDSTDTGAHPGASSYVYDAADDTNGHRWIIGSPVDMSTDGGAYQTASPDPGLKTGSRDQIAFWIGFVQDGSSAQTGDTASDLALQYAGWISETVRAVRR